MDWIKAHYDRLALILAASFLFICAILIWRNVIHFGTNLIAQPGTFRHKPASPPGKAVDLTHAAEKLQQSPQWTFSGRSGLFVPEKYFIGADGLPATLKTTQVHPPVPNEWFEEYGLPIGDADVLDQDPDGDGFTNLDEWQGHTNPTDQNSHPDYVTKLTVASASMEPFHFMFSSRMEDTFGINTIDYTQPTQFLTVGDTIGGTRFKIIKFTPKSERNQYGTSLDVSELLLEHEDTKEQLTLVKEKVATSPQSVVIFTYSWPANKSPQQFQVRKDQEFSLKPNEEIKYKLIDVQPAKAVIVNTQKPNEPIEIGFGAP
jgi:hypothetical protein